MRFESVVGHKCRLILGYPEGHKGHCLNENNPDYFMKLIIKAFDVLTSSKDEKWL